VPLIVACALFMENLDSTVLATALPAIARSLGENPLRLNLAISAYLSASPSSFRSAAGSPTGSRAHRPFARPSASSCWARCCAA